MRLRNGSIPASATFRRSAVSVAKGSFHGPCGLGPLRERRGCLAQLSRKEPHGYPVPALMGTGMAADASWRRTAGRPYRRTACKGRPSGDLHRPLRGADDEDRLQRLL